MASAETARPWPADYLGGPAAAAICGVGYKTALQVWGELRGLVPPPQMSERMDWGLRLEEAVAKRYAEVTGREVRRHSRLIRHPQYRFVGGHIDRFVFDKILGRAVLEIKTTGSHLAEQWETEPPLSAQIQLQHYLLVSGAQWGSIAALIGGQRFLTFDVKRNEAFIANLLKREIEFWACVQNGTPPAPVAADNKLLASIYSPEDPDGIVDLPAEALQFDVAIRDAKETAAKAIEAKEDAEANLKALIGKATIGRLPGGDAYRWKTEPRKSFTVEASTPRVLRRIKL